MTALFELQAVSKRIGHRTILDELSFRIDPGGFTLLLGNNGAGKTTLLRLLSGLMRPSLGTLRFRGEPYPRAAEALRRAVGMLSHESRLYGDLSAAENLRLFGTLHGMRELERRIATALERVRLEHVAEIPLRAFSSGMTKRVAIARLILCEPSVLLLDEPYSGLDQASLAMLDEWLTGFQAAGGTTLMTTHQFTSRTVQCDRILILHQGRLVYNRHEERPSAQRCAQLLNQYASGSPADAPSPVP
jgi:heme exporter protein A